MSCKFGQRAVLNASHQTENIATLPAHITKRNVLDFLHDHEKMIQLNPMVASHHLLDDSGSINFFKSEAPEYRASTKDGAKEVIIPVFSVTDDMDRVGAEFEAQGGSWRGGWSKRFIPSSITYSMSMQDRDDGLVSITHAPMGVHNVTTWLVKEPEDGQGRVTVEERGICTSNRMLMGFIKTTLQQSHDKLVKDFVAALEREDKAARPDGDETEKVT